MIRNDIILLSSITWVDKLTDVLGLNAGSSKCMIMMALFFELMPSAVLSLALRLWTFLFFKVIIAVFSNAAWAIDLDLICLLPYEGLYTIAADTWVVWYSSTVISCSVSCVICWISHWWTASALCHIFSKWPHHCSIFLSMDFICKERARLLKFSSSPLHL